ncbi:hypothetical protein [Sphingomonas xinjiangensis]|uniref:Uncharacterized protein n=1 Tax=Sphingomonas xinjiangensis TaxID=643568 RepID=A0A840YDW1_9SPHN|nr:hypothetical protein [Sphingomonas xinjiangensis]MBB5708978.1 hypothetical protein [Sphingomonas xinjiangensis]
MKLGKILAAAALALSGVAAGASPATAAATTSIAAASSPTFMAASSVSNIQRYRDGDGWGRDHRRWDRRDRRGWNRGRHDRRGYNRGRYYRQHRACWNEWRRGRPVTVCARR